MTHGFALHIPAEGLLEIFHTEEPLTKDYIALVLRTDEVSLAHVEANHGDHTVDLYFYPSFHQIENERAQRFSAGLFGWHMKFWGGVLIDNLTEEQVFGYVKDENERTASLAEGEPDAKQEGASPLGGHRVHAPDG